MDVGRAPETDELTDLLDQLAWPDAVTVDDLLARATGEFHAWLTERKNARTIPHRLEDAGYVVVRNPDERRGRWNITRSQRVVYGRSALSASERFAAVRRLAQR